MGFKVGNKVIHIISNTKHTVHNINKCKKCNSNYISLRDKGSFVDNIIHCKFCGSITYLDTKGIWLSANEFKLESLEIE